MHKRRRRTSERDQKVRRRLAMVCKSMRASLRFARNPLVEKSKLLGGVKPVLAVFHDSQ